MGYQGISVLVIFAFFATIADAGTTFRDEDSGESESSVEVQHDGGGDYQGYQNYQQEEGPQLFEKDEEGEQQVDFGHDQGGYQGYGQEDSGSFGEDESYGANEGGYYHGGGEKGEGGFEGGKGY